MVFQGGFFLFRQEFSFSQSYRFFPSFCQALAEDRVTTPTKKKKRTAQQIGRCLESAVRSPCNFSGSVLPSGFFIGMLDSNSETLRRVLKADLYLLIVLAGLLKSQMRSMDCKVVQCSNRKC